MRWPSPCRRRDVRRVIDRVDRSALSTRGIAEPARPDDLNAIELVACGQPIPDHEIRIIDDMGRELGERREGRLEFRGPSATSGYFENAAKTRELFHDGWLDTGDRAYMAGGDLFITGRIKDIIIRAGQHIAPHEIEEAVGAIPGLRKNGVAAFGVTDPASGTERVVILAETDGINPSAQAALKVHAQEVATHIVGGPPDEIVLVQPGTVPKTASGKIRRAAARDLYLGKNLGAAAACALVAARALEHRGAGHTRLAGCAAVIGGAALCRLVVDGDRHLLPARLARRDDAAAPDLAMGAVRALARTALAALGVPVSVTGADHLPSGGGVLALNHSSYMDAVIVAAVLPGEPTYVVKKELAGQIFAGPLLRRLGVLFLERFDVSDSLADLESVTAAAREKRLLVFFPEGTFTRRAGLSGFYLGAFRVAAEANLPVMPGHPARNAFDAAGRAVVPALEPDQRRRSRTRSRPRAPILPRWCNCATRCAVSLLAGCGEPDLGELIKPVAPVVDQ